MRRYLLVLLLLGPMAVYAEISFSDLERITLSPERLEGEFRQEKFLKSVEAQLDSNGMFVYQRGESIRWKMLQPIQSELIMTANGITSKQSNGELRRLDEVASPIAATISQIFFSVLTADWENLSKYFQLTGEISEKHWQVALVPESPVILQVINRIEISGDQLLKKIVLHENRGNRTTIYLENMR